MIAIAGGGIGGLTLAVALQQQGMEVAVFELQAEIRDTGAGISLWPNALAALDSIGLGQAVRAIGRSSSSGGTRKLDGRDGLTFSSRRFEAALGEGLSRRYRSACSSGGWRRSPATGPASKPWPPTADATDESVRCGLTYPVRTAHSSAGSGTDSFCAGT